MSAALRRRLERLEAESMAASDMNPASDEEIAALSYLRHVIRANEPSAASAGRPISDREWEELWRAGLVPEIAAGTQPSANEETHHE